MMKKDKIEVKATLKEVIAVITILLVWAFSVILVYGVANFETCLLWILLTVPGLFCWMDSMVKLQKFEGRRKVVVR